MFTGLHSYSAQWSWLGTVSVFFSFFVMYGIIILVALLPFLFFLKETQIKRKLYFLRIWLLYVGVLSSTYLIGVVLKFLTAVPRPYEAIATLEPLMHAGVGNSFPSLHSAIAVAIASVTAVWSRRLSLLLWVIAVFIMCSRIIVGVHYPLDVVCGALLGWAVALVGKNFYRKYA